MPRAGARAGVRGGAGATGRTPRLRWPWPVPRHLQGTARPPPDPEETPPQAGLLGYAEAREQPQQVSRSFPRPALPITPIPTPPSHPAAGSTGRLAAKAIPADIPTPRVLYQALCIHPHQFIQCSQHYRWKSRGWALKFKFRRLPSNLVLFVTVLGGSSTEKWWNIDGLIDSLIQ